MYEINLVPDVKTELLNKQKLRNLVILVCIVLSAASVGFVAILGGIAATQAITIATKDNEIKCRSTGDGSGCKNTGTAVYKFSNVGELLTMQGQMHDLDLLNQNHLLLSRIFPMFDMILPSGSEGTVKISTISANFDEMAFAIEANSTDSKGYVALEAFRKGLDVTYYDYGRYMRYDTSTNEYVEIPTYCIEEEMIDGYLYGRYYKGWAGCETDLIEKSSDNGDDDADDDDDNASTDDDVDDDDKDDDSDKKTVSGVEEILIRRTYENEQDLNNYKEGTDKLSHLVNKTVKGYYFNSACIVYDGDGELDETSTVEKCPIVTQDMDVLDRNYGRNDDGNMVLTFSAQLYVNKEIFKSINKHMSFGTPNRRNVTDSYVPVRDMFSSTETVVDNGETK